jgi:3-oxoacyl-[acyl-carrier protein] reductase
MDMGLLGKIAVVTGSGRNIGKAIALGLAQEGVDVAINCVSDRVSAERTAEEIRAIGRRSMVVMADVANEAEVHEMVGNVVAAWGGIDILVNSAGIGFVALVEDMKKSEWDRLFDVIAGGTFNCSKAVLPSMKQRGGGKIINIASVAGERTSQNSSANYVAAKSAVFGFTRQLAYELAPLGINVNAVSPWTVVTPLSIAQVGVEALEKIKKGIPLREYPKPEDVANAVVFLSSNRSKMITGYSIRIDGGMTLPVGTRTWEDYVESHKEAAKKRSE